MPFFSIRTAAYWTFLLGCVCPATLCAADPPPVGQRDGVRPRNVVFVLTDDHRYDAMGFYGTSVLGKPRTSIHSLPTESI